jgi:ATP-dependent RNA helicase DOB1
LLNGFAGLKNSPATSVFPKFFTAVYTDYRPTPLQHYVFPCGGQGIFLVVDDEGKFKEENFSKALAVLGDNVDVNDGQQNKRRRKPTEGADLNKILKMIMENNFHPVIVFSFSKKEVEGYASVSFGNLILGHELI